MINNIISNLLSGRFVLIAEAGVNYYDIAIKENISNMDAAKLMIKKAAEAGLPAIKFQTYKAETLAAKESPSYWDTSMEPITSQYELFKKFDSFGREEYQELADFCEEQNIEFLSTAFDYESADYLDDMMNVYKISSSDLNNLPFVKYQAQKGKPIILSVGASNLDEIKTTINTIRLVNDQPIVLLHCVLEYPTPLNHANLNKIISLKKEFPDLIIGYSDHTKTTQDCVVQTTAYNLGAICIEKHFTLDKSIHGSDHLHSMDDRDAHDILERISQIDNIRGSYDIRCLDSELISRANA
ncbi:MAG: N-acetylneuraminate synthase family protein [Eubacteriales bacterium]|nr:N-acetylneuraminate synthase family protein [Eubacteriales bacterium]